MRHFWSLLRALAALAIMVGAPAHAAERSFGLSSFERLSLEGDFVVIVTTSNQYRAVASGPREALDRLSVEQSGMMLKIKEKKFSSTRPRAAGVVTIRISGPNLKSAAVEGAGTLTIDQMRGIRAEVSLRGPGALTITRMAIDNLAVAMIGNGVMTLGGTAKNARLLSSGASVIRGEMLSVSDLVVDSEGNGDIHVAATRSARVTARGVGRVTIDGRAACTVVNTGNATVVCGK